MASRQWSFTLATASQNILAVHSIVDRPSSQASARFKPYRQLHEECRIVNASSNRRDNALPSLCRHPVHSPSWYLLLLASFFFCRRGSRNGKSHDAGMPSCAPISLNLPWMFTIPLTHHWPVVHTCRLRLSLRPSLLLRDTPPARDWLSTACWRLCCSPPGGLAALGSCLHSGPFFSGLFFFFLLYFVAELIHRRQGFRAIVPLGARLLLLTG